MQFTITCPECGTALSADETCVGNFVSCSVCRHQMPIPKFSMSRPTIEQQEQCAAKPAEETVQDTETAASAPAAAAPVPEDSTLSPEVSQESDIDSASEKTDRIKELCFMAMYNISCPKCGGTLEVQEDWSGMETECPLCRNAFVIPPRQQPPGTCRGAEAPQKSGADMVTAAVFPAGK